jgi:hypothetical protein
MIINRFNEANEYTLLERVKDTFTNLMTAKLLLL